MNFEQNFSPLDTGSFEYQSLNVSPISEPISADPEQEEPKKPLAKIEQPVKIREIKPLPKVTAPKVDMAKVPKVERGPSFTFPAEEVDTLYNSFSDSSNYINGIISQKLKEFDNGGEQTKGAADSVRGYMSLINQANNPNDLAKRTDLVYNMMNEISDIQTNNATRDSFINSQYTPAFYSKSKALADEYNASDLKSVLTPRQYTGLKSLSYGKQGEYQDYLNTITDPKAKDVDKELALLNLDKIGAAIDTNASAKLISDIKAGKADKNNLVFGRDLYLQSRYDLLNADEKIRDVEFNNPYNLSVTKNILNRAVERGLLMGESADMLSISSDLSGIDVNRLAEIQRLQQEARGSKAFEEFYNNPSLETFSKNPIGILTELTMESLVALYSHGASRVGAGALQGAAVGTVLPGLGTAAGAGYGVLAGMGLASLNLEMSSAILEGIADAGYDTTSAEDLRKAFQDEKLMSKLKADGYKKGIPIAIFDMLSAGVAGKIITKPAKTVAGKVLAGVAELGAQAGFGMIGEAAGQVVKSGKVYKPVDVLMEGLGEIGPGIPEIAFGAITEKAKNNQAQAKRDLAIVIDGLGLQKANDQIDVLIGSGQVSQEQGQKLKDEAKKAFEQMQKMPSMLSNDARGQIMELVDKRDALMSSSENLDDVFKKQAIKEAEAINAQILDVANKDIGIQKEVKEEVVPEATQEKVAFQKAAEPIKVSNVNISQVDDITATMNQMETPSVEFKVDDAVKVGFKADVNNLVTRTTNAATPKVVSVSDFIGKPIMVTISDELTTGNIVNPATGNTIAGLMGGIGFNYTEGNTGYAWAYTDEATAQDTLNTAKEIYKRNPEMFPDGIVPVAVVKMGTEAINSNEAVFRVLLDNLNSFPKKNLINAYNKLKLDISNQIARIEAKQKALKAKGESLKQSEKVSLNGYKQILNEYLNKNKSIQDVIINISELNIGVRPLITDRITSGEVGVTTDINRLRVDKPVTKALMQGLPKEDIKKINLGWIAEPLRDPSIKNVPARHVIGFVGIDATADSIQKSGHPNYPFALKGMGLGVVEDTVHLASIMPTAYGNAVKKITDVIAKNKRITPAESVSRAMPSGLANAIFKGKPIVEQESELSKLIGFLNLSFPSVTFFTDQQSFEDIVASPDVKKYVREGEIIYGLTTDGKIYLNPSIATANTAIHEMGHIWVDYVQNMNPELFNKGISLVEGTDEFEKAKAQLGDNINARKEALAMLIGNRGETITNAAQKSKFKEWLVGLWKFLQEQFPALRSLKPKQIETLTLEQFLGGALKDILSGEPISEKPEEYVQIGAAAQKMSDIVPFEPQLPEGPQGPTPPGEVGPVKEGGGPVQKAKREWEYYGEGEAEKVGEEMIKTSTGRYVAQETLAGQMMDRERALKEVKKNEKGRLAKLYESTKVGMIDNQYKVLSLLESVGRAGELVRAYLTTRNSASATSVPMAEDATKRIFGNLSKRKKYKIGTAEISEYVLFNNIIGYRRVISIQNQMNETYRSMLAAYESGNLNEYNKHKNRLVENNMLDENGEYSKEVLNTEFGMGQITASQAKGLLESIRASLNEQEFEKLMKLSDEYSNFYNEMMRSRMMAGLISEESYNYLSRFYYAPTRYLNPVLMDPILSISKSTVPYSKSRNMEIKKLSGGSERLNVNDYEGLLKATIYASEYSIAENRTTNRFYNLIEKNKDAFEEKGMRLGTRYIPIEEKQGMPTEDAIDRNVKMITEGKKPVFGKELAYTQKQLSYKGIQKVSNSLVKLQGSVNEVVPSTSSNAVDAEIVVDDNGNRYYAVQVPTGPGEKYIKTYFNGQRRDIIVPDWFAEAWNNENITYLGDTTLISQITGATLLRLVATGINPVFGVAQIIPDTISAYAATVGSRKYVPLLIDYPIFFAKTLKAYSDIKNNSADYIEATKYGATTNFYNGGSVSFERGLSGKEDRSLEKVIEAWNVPGLKQYVMGSKRITEITEQMSKVALYKSIRDSKISEYKEKNGVEPTGVELDDIKIEAGAMARSTADFHRKGTLGSEMNKLIPYLNAGIQVQRAVLSSAKKNKAKATYYTIAFAGYTTSLLLNAIGMWDDDELKERKRVAYSKWSKFDKENRIPIFFIESKNKFVSIKLPSFLVPINAFVSTVLQRGIIEQKLDYSSPKFWNDLEQIGRAVADEFPLLQFVNYDKTLSRNPGFAAVRKFFFNVDPYRGEKVVEFEEITKDYLEGARLGEKRAAEIYQKIGKAATSILPEGISPKRLEAAASSIPFENNPFTGVLIFATEFGTSEKQLFDERYGKGAVDKILKFSGISQRFFKEGTKINQDLIGLSANEIKDRGEFKDTLALYLTDRLESLSKTETKSSAVSKVVKDYVKEIVKLDPEQSRIAKEFLRGDFVKFADALYNKEQDPMLAQIIRIPTADAKIDAIYQTLEAVKISELSKDKFLKDMWENYIFNSKEVRNRMFERGYKINEFGAENKFYEPQVGEIVQRYMKLFKNGEISLNK